jgi:adenine-specific DNA glycosylase
VHGELPELCLHVHRDGQLQMRDAVRVQRDVVAPQDHLEGGEQAVLEGGAHICSHRYAPCTSSPISLRIGSAEA